ncbi:MAG: YesL family protein [Clostridiales bacterium]|nr:YesL family protein [Clostridiales bacterium]
MKKNKKKVSSFFSYDGDFYYYTGKIFDVIMLGVLWLVGCIPVITIGASFTALHAAMYHSVKQDRGSFGKEFWKAYRSNMKASIPIWLILFGVVFVLLLNMGILYNKMNTQIGWFFIILYLVVAIIFILAGCYVFPALSRFDMPTGWLYKLAFVMVFRHLPYTLTMGGLLVVSYLLVMKYPMLILVIPGAVSWISSLMIDPLLDRYMPESSAEKKTE